MTYTPYLKGLINEVEATRASRINNPYPRMTPAERTDVLNNYHPDHIAAGFRSLKVGVSRGERAPTELVNFLEAPGRIAADHINLEQPVREVEVLVVGGGGAGAAAALEAHSAGADVLIITKLRFGDSNTIMAQGGIQAADKANDSPAIHYLDVLGGGGYVNIPPLVKALVMDAPSIISWLEDMGVMFDKQADGTMQTIHGGGTSRKRMHAARDYTGAEIMRTLRDEVYNRGIEVQEFSPAVEIVLDEQGRAAGVVVINLETEEYAVIKAKTVILATGGSGRLHYQDFPTSNHYGATGDGLVMGYRAGARLSFMDTIQYHPTGAAYPPQLLGLLVTEKVRGLGATFLNSKGEQFVYNLETRDVASSAIIRECGERNMGITTPTGMKGVWLDAPLIDALHGEGTIEKQLPAMLRQFRRFDIDIRKDPILIYPTLHYQNGGLLIDEDARSTVENLYVAGENAGGIHGRNRLMGNSLLDILVFGRRAGRHAAAAAGQTVFAEKLTIAHLERYRQELAAAGPANDTPSPLLLPRYGRCRDDCRAEVVD